MDRYLSEEVPILVMAREAAAAAHEEALYFPRGGDVAGPAADPDVAQLHEA